MMRRFTEWRERRPEPDWHRFTFDTIVGLVAAVGGAYVFLLFRGWLESFPYPWRFLVGLGIALALIIPIAFVADRIYRKRWPR